MAYTLSDTVTKVQQRIRDTGYSSTEIKNYINDTQNDVFNEYRLPFMEASQAYTLATGVSDITNGSGLPTNFVQGIDLVLTSLGKESKLIYRDIRQMDELYPDWSDTTAYPPNTPTDWFYFAETARVHPAPNADDTVTLYYYKKPTILSADADVPEVPSEFQELLVVGAAYRVMQVKDNYDQAGILENKYAELLQKLVTKYSQAQVGTPTIMRSNYNGISKTNY